MRKIYLIPLLFVLSQNAFAGWHYDNLVGFNAHTNGELSITVETTHECGSQVIAVSNPEFEHIDRIISVLLSHQAQNKKVRFSIQSCSGNTAIIDRVRTY